uniref:UMP/CMP kinase n=1 Tax=Entomoneis paludosa TaxID=265537 RepID=A0A7S2V7U3_9STRA|mmetsp:Transcript_11365/g.23302  ORF Transcript_11365/g.23302 Transcript_11365/m.23302 type:complete len:253 (+) Transcript_11365:95-853(+)
MVRLRVCPFSVVVFFGTAAYLTYQLRNKNTQKRGGDDDNNDGTESKQQAASTSSSTSGPCQVVFVLGGPGAGKGTQCQLLQERLSGWKHLSAGDLLRAERKKGGELGDLINSRIAAGALVPSEVTCQLLLNAMNETSEQKFLIDGFPRSQENLDAWNKTAAASGNVQLEFVLCLTCPEEVLTGRLLERGKTSGRVDDADLSVIRKRYDTFGKETQPILDYYKAQGGDLLKQIESDQSVEQVYQQIVVLFEKI